MCCILATLDKVKTTTHISIDKDKNHKTKQNQSSDDMPTDSHLSGKFVFFIVETSWVT